MGNSQTRIIIKQDFERTLLKKKIITKAICIKNKWNTCQH